MRGAGVLSGAVTVSVLVMEEGTTKPIWDVVGVTVISRGVGIIICFCFFGSAYLTAEAAAATFLARLNPVVFLGVSELPRFGVTEETEMFVTLGIIGSKGERLGLYVSASLHCFLMYLQ